MLADHADRPEHIGALHRQTAGLDCYREYIFFGHYSVLLNNCCRVSKFVQFLQNYALVRLISVDFAPVSGECPVRSTVIFTP